MANLFDEADFALFSQYQDKSQDEAPDGFDKLRNIYDKLGKITYELNQLGYTAEIIRNPLRQAGRGQSMKYGDYHWARVYPKDLYEDCGGKIFVVVGTSQDGLNIHIDSYGSKGYECNEEADRIKENTWEQLLPQEASQLSCEEIVKKVIDYIEYNWESFNLFGKEFRIRTCIENLNKMEMEKIKKLLLSNHNLILTGAPGTGKTHLAMTIAESLGSDWELVQFHPSYDYTDFVEGLRPIKKGTQLGFQRIDGVFKNFCKKALGASTLFSLTYKELVRELKTSDISSLDTDLRKTYVNENNHIVFKSTDGRPANKEKHYISESKLLELYLKIAENIQDFEDETKITKDKCKEFNGGKEVDTTAPLILKELFKRSKKELVRLSKKPISVIIIYEINRC